MKITFKMHEAEELSALLASIGRRSLTREVADSGMEPLLEGMNASGAIDLAPETWLTILSFAHVFGCTGTAERSARMVAAKVAVNVMDRLEG